VWVPFTSEAKEAVAHYDDLLREMKFAVQECGRKLGTHLRQREKAQSEQKRLSLFQRYIPEVSAAIGSILGSEKDKIETAFIAALPNFVRMLETGEAEGPPESEGGSGAPPALAAMGDDEPKGTIPPPPRKTSKAASKTVAGKKAATKPEKKTRKSTQLELI
jgi:hypothetical protein